MDPGSAPPTPPRGCTHGNTPAGRSPSPTASSSPSRSTTTAAAFLTCGRRSRWPISDDADRAQAEHILLRAAAQHAVTDDQHAEQALSFIPSRYALSGASLEPAVYWRITDNWLELWLRFLVPHRGVRMIKDRMSRDILTGLDQARISVASAIVGLPELRITQPADPTIPPPEFDP